MTSVKSIWRDLIRAALCAGAVLFIIPALVWIFTAHVLSEQDAAFRATTQVATANAVASRLQALQAFRNTPPSSACSATTDAALDAFRAEHCAPLSPKWQFVWANRISKVTVAGGVLLLLSCAWFGLAALRNREVQCRSVVNGWRVLVWGSMAELLVQGAMLTWLTYWLPATFWNKYFTQIIMLIAVLAGLAALSAIRTMCKRSSAAKVLDGEIITAQDAPELWARIGELAAKVGTPPPRHVIAGIDASFFVTEGDVFVGDRTLRGCSLFVSLPLLRILDTDETDALLAHELAHLDGGDSAGLAAIGPKLSEFDQYTASMTGAKATLIAYYLLNLYRMVLDLALQKEYREREFIADLVAARHTSAGAIVRSLVKISGYGVYRARVEEQLVARQREWESEQSIAEALEAGLQSFVYAADFIEYMMQADVPHPFDAHPSLAERMGSLGTQIDPAEYSAVLLARRGNAWIDDIPAAVHVEKRLWSAYENRIAQGHQKHPADREPVVDSQRHSENTFARPPQPCLSGATALS